MARQRVEPRISPVITRPTASPVDTYVKPGVSSAEQLAQALAEVSPKVGRFSEVLSEQYAQKKYEEGMQAARVHSEQALKAGEFTREGQLPMQDNPWFMKGFKEEQGKVAAGIWQSDFKAMMDNDPKLKDSTNLADFDTAVGTHLSQWMEQKGLDRDLHFEKGFGNMKDQYVAMARLGFAEGIEKKLDVKSDEQFFALVKRSITDNWGREGVTAEVLAKDIDTMVASAVKRGRPDVKARTSATLAIAAAARELGPEQGLRVLDILKKASGEGGKGHLKDQSYGAKALEEVETDLIHEAHQTAEMHRAEKRRLKEERKEDIVKQGFELLNADPNANLAKFLREHPDADPEVVGALRALKEQNKDLNYETNQEVYNDLFQRIYSPEKDEKYTSITEVVSKGRNKLLRAEDQQRLIGLIEQQRERAKEHGKDPLDKKADYYLNLAERMFDDAYRDPTTGIVPADKAQRVQFSKALLMSRWMDLKDSGKAQEMSPNEMNQWFLQESDSIRNEQRSSFLKDFHPGGAAPSMPDVKEGQPEAKKPAELPSKLILTTEDLKAYKAGKTSKVEAKAAAAGIPIEQVRDFVFEQSQLLTKTKKKE